MRKTFLLLTTTYLFLSTHPPLEDNVYICKGKSSKRYHLKKSCRGLSSCKSGVSEVTLKKAKDIGKTLCKWED